MRRANAFTLIEVLVVVAIIGLLAAVLIPSLAAARHQARSRVCLSNCNQIGMAMQTYRMQYRDRFPSSGGHGADADPKNWWLSVLARHVKRPLLFRCPEEETAHFLDWNDVNWDDVSPEQHADYLENYRWGSYALNYLVVKQPDPYCDHLSRIRRPVYTVFVAESEPSLKAVDHIHPEKFVMIPPERMVAVDRHLERSNYVFADSHAEARRIEETWEPEKRDLWNPASAPQWVDPLTPPPPPP